jgi:hypothetical protein
MAIINATTWARGFWEASIESSLANVDSVLVKALGQVSAGTIQTTSNTIISGLLNPSGSYAIYGNGFETATRIEGVSISQLTFNAPGINLELQGNLRGGGVLGMTVALIVQALWLTDLLQRLGVICVLALTARYQLLIRLKKRYCLTVFI